MLSIFWELGLLFFLGVASRHPSIDVYFSSGYKALSVGGRVINYITDGSMPKWGDTGVRLVSQAAGRWASACNDDNGTYIPWCPEDTHGTGNNPFVTEVIRIGVIVTCVMVGSLLLRSRYARMTVAALALAKGIEFLNYLASA